MSLITRSDDERLKPQELTEYEMVVRERSLLMENSLRAALSRAEKAESRLSLLEKVAEELMARMDRARSILRDPSCGGRPDSNWGMLDTSFDRHKLRALDAGKEES